MCIRDSAYILEKAEDIELGDEPAKITACDHMKQYAAHLRSLICKGIGVEMCIRDRPNPLLSYLVKIVRNISLKIYWRKERCV